MEDVEAAVIAAAEEHVRREALLSARSARWRHDAFSFPTASPMPNSCSPGVALAHYVAHNE